MACYTILVYRDKPENRQSQQKTYVSVTDGLWKKHRFQRQLQILLTRLTIWVWVLTY